MTRPAISESKGSLKQENISQNTNNCLLFYTVEPLYPKTWDREVPLSRFSNIMRASYSKCSKIAN